MKKQYSQLRTTTTNDNNDNSIGHEEDEDEEQETVRRHTRLLFPVANVLLTPGLTFDASVTLVNDKEEDD